MMAFWCERVYSLTAFRIRDLYHRSGYSGNVLEHRLVSAQMLGVSKHHSEMLRNPNTGGLDWPYFLSHTRIKSYTMWGNIAPCLSSLYSSHI